MLRIKNLRGECQHCGGPIEFHAEHVGAAAACPHCGQSTELALATPPDEVSPLRKKAIAFAVIVALILVAGMVGTTIALKRARRLKAERAPVAPQSSVPAPLVATGPFAPQAFEVSSVALDKGGGGSLVYATGTVRNFRAQPRFGVKVNFELSDASGQKIGTASDYQKVMEPNGEWQFRALVVDREAVSARVTEIGEAQ